MNISWQRLVVVGLAAGVVLFAGNEALARRNNRGGTKGGGKLGDVAFVGTIKSVDAASNTLVVDGVDKNTGNNKTESAAATKTFTVPLHCDYDDGVKFADLKAGTAIEIGYSTSALGATANWISLK